jgi:hypothetical protein
MRESARALCIRARRLRESSRRICISARAHTAAAAQQRPHCSINWNRLALRHVSCAGNVSFLVLRSE